MTNPTESTEHLNEPIDESHAEFWRKNAQDYLKGVLEDPEKEIKSRNAKNIILFLGDGMSLSTVAATRMYYLGNENKQLSFEKFAHLGLSKVGSFTSIYFIYQVYKSIQLISFTYRSECNLQNDEYLKEIIKWLCVHFYRQRNRDICFGLLAVYNDKFNKRN